MIKFLVLIMVYVWYSHAFSFKDGLYELNSQSFNELFIYTKQKNGAMMIYFYSFNEDPRQSYLTEFKRAGKELHIDGDKVFLSILNVDTEPEIASKYNAFNTPKVVVLSAQEGMRYRYMKGIKSKRDIIKYARTVVPPGPKFFLNHTMFDHIFSEGHHLFVGFFENLQSKETEAFERFARFMRYQNFAYTNNISMAEDFNLTKRVNGIALFYKREMLNEYEPKFIEYNDTSITLNTWGLRNYLLPVDIYDKYNHEFFNNKYRFKTMLWFESIILDNYDSNFTKYRDYLNQVLPDVENYTELALVSQDHFKFLQSKLDTYHFAELVALKNGEWYKSFTPPMSENGTFRFDILKKFVEDVYYNNIEPFIKSESIPDEMYKNGITYLVGQNFEK